MHEPAGRLPGELLMKQIIRTDAAPAAIGLYSQGTVSGTTLYTSGQIGIDPASGKLADGIEAQARQAFRNVSAIAAAAGGTLDDALKITIFLSDMADFATVNAAMGEFVAPPYPARSCVAAAALPKGALVEVEAVVDLSGRKA